MEQVNHFDIKKSAHRMARRDTQTWNPFRHLTWDRSADGQPRSGRSETWNGDVEAQTDLNTLEHAKSEPISPSHRGILGQSLGESSKHGKETGDLANLSARDETTTESQQSTAPLVAAGTGKDGEPNGLRNRKQEGTNSTVDTQTTADKEKPETDDKQKKQKKDHKFMKRIQPKQPFTVANQLQRTFLSSWINILILAAPAGIAMSHVGVNGIAVFVVNFLAIIPLAAMLSFATEEIALRTGETLGGLLNATFGNAVELIVAILALAHDEILIVKTSLIGSILSNLLLVLGFCFFFGGLRRLEQHFNTTVAQTAASLLALAIGSVIIPTVFDTSTPASDSAVASISRGVAVILLVVYAGYLIFQLKTHSEVFNEESQKVPAKPWSHGHQNSQEHSLASGLMHGGVTTAIPRMDTTDRERLSKIVNRHKSDDEDDDEEDEPQLEFIVALATLGISTVIIAFCADAMVTSIGDVTSSGGLTQEFVGLILLPIVGNAAEHVTAVTVAMKDKMDLAIGVAVGSSMQVALFLIPLLVVIGWGLGKQDMDLSFDIFQVAVMFVAVLLVNYLIADGKSHWLEGLLLMCLYAIIAVCSFFYPNTGENLAG